MKVMMAIKGTEDTSFFENAAALAPLDHADRILLAHSIDPTPHADLERSRERFLGKRSLGTLRTAELLQLEEERARAILRFARQELVTAGVPDGRIDEITLRGKPNEELRRQAEELQVDLIVVHGKAGKTGPHSVGKTARFLIDHCPQAALLVR